MSDGVKRYNPWFMHIHSLAEKQRKEWVRKVIDEVRAEGLRKKSKEIEAMADFLSDSSKCQIIGFCPYVEYTRVSGDLEHSYLHAFGSPLLLCKVKNLPSLMIIGPGIKWNKSDIPVDVEGITG